MLKNTFLREWLAIINRLNYLVSLMQFYTFSLVILSKLLLGNIANKFSRQSGSSKSRKASMNCGYLYLIK